MATKKNAGKGSSFTEKELQDMKKHMVEERDRILEELISIKGEALNKSSKDASGDLSGYSFHMADMATDLYDREFALELAEGERILLFSLRDAIRRIDEGMYGVCDICEAKISKQRLKVMPQAEHCIKCQEEKEKSSGR